VRDSSQHFNAKSSFWGPFTKNPDITDDKRKDIEEQIEQINQSILDSHKPFEVVKDRIAQTGKLLPLAAKDLVSIEAVPARIMDILARTQVKLAARTGARLPIAQHGAGTQSLSVLFLFEAFLQSRLAEAYDKDSSPILALEEPESHLHPSAIRALWTVLDKLAGQKIVASHSGDLVSAVPLTALRRLSRRNGVVKVFRVNPANFNARDLEKVAYHVRAKRGALLFARCWVLVEGETDFSLVPEFAQILGHDLDLCGVSCVEFSQCWPTPLIKVAKDLGIEWHLLADGDAAGNKYVQAAVLRKLRRMMSSTVFGIMATMRFMKRPLMRTTSPTSKPSLGMCYTQPKRSKRRSPAHPNPNLLTESWRKYARLVRQVSRIVSRMRLNKQ
jgi:putative ATP-dependent endonuclease of OLD family